MEPQNTDRDREGRNGTVSIDPQGHGIRRCGVRAPITYGSVFLTKSAKSLDKHALRWMGIHGFRVVPTVPWREVRRG